MFLLHMDMSHTLMVWYGMFAMLIHSLATHSQGQILYEEPMQIHAGRGEFNTLWTKTEQCKKSHTTNKKHFKHLTHLLRTGALEVTNDLCSE